MRLVILCHKFWPSVGGLQTYTQRLTEFLQAQGHRVDVFTTRSPATAPRREQLAANLAVHRFPTRLANHFPFHFMPRLLASAGQDALRSADIIHSVGYQFFPTVLGYWLASVFDIPHVVTPVLHAQPGDVAATPLRPGARSPSRPRCAASCGAVSTRARAPSRTPLRTPRPFHHSLRCRCDTVRTRCRHRVATTTAGAHR